MINSNPKVRPWIEASWFYWSHWSLGLDFKNDGYSCSVDVNLIRFRISIGYTYHKYSHVDALPHVFNQMVLSGRPLTEEQQADMIRQAEAKDNKKWWQMYD
jgi:hypothetical protein